MSEAPALFHSNIRPGRIIAWTLLLIGGLIMVSPLAFMFSTSFKTADQVYDLRLVPAAPTLANYIAVLADGRFTRWFYQPPPIGVINDVFGMLGIPQQPFIRSVDQALFSIMVTAIWAGLGFQIIIFMAGLRAIPTTFYEAARIDGLGEWAILRKITLPLLKPTTVFLVVFSSIGFLRIFDQVYNMTTNDPGGPLGSTKPLVLMIYQTAFNSYAMGYAAAQTVVLFTILLVVSLLQLFILRDKK